MRQLSASLALAPSRTAAQSLQRHFLTAAAVRVELAHKLVRKPAHRFLWGQEGAGLRLSLLLGVSCATLVGWRRQRRAACTLVRRLAFTRPRRQQQRGRGQTRTLSSRPSPPVREGEVLSIEIDALASRGQGVGRVGSSRWVVFVFGALPGEVVEVCITRNFKSTSEARLRRVLKAAPDRVEPKCNLFMTCSGCQYQHLSYESQLAWKRQHVLDAMQRIGKFDLEEIDVHETVSSPLQYHYRNKMTPHTGEERHTGRRRSRWEGSSSNPVAIGFLQEEWGEQRSSTGRRWKEVVDVPQCTIVTEAMNAALPAAREEARSARGSFQGALLLRDTHHDGVVTDPDAVVMEEVPGVGAFSFRAGGFFQNNSAILPVFVEHVVDALSRPGSDQEAPIYLVDAYCGVGLFAIASASRFQQVVGIELDSQAVAHAHRNAERHGAANCTFLAADACAGLRSISVRKLKGSQTALLVDPPRSGLDKNMRQALLTMMPQRLVYVSCDFGTQARDLQELCQEHYRCVSVTPFDLFPQTRHLETVAVLERKAVDSAFSS